MFKEKIIVVDPRSGLRIKQHNEHNYQIQEHHRHKPVGMLNTGETWIFVDTFSTETAAIKEFEKLRKKRTENILQNLMEKAWEEVIENTSC